MLAGTLELVVLRLVLPVEINWPDTAGQWAAVGYIGLFPTAIAFFAWYEAMRLIKLSLLSVMQYLTPVFTLLLAWTFLGERMNLWQIAGIVVVLAGIALVSWRRGSRKSIPAGDQRKETA